MSPLHGNGSSQEGLPSPQGWVLTWGKGNQRVEANGTWMVMEGGVSQGENASSRGAMRGIWVVSESLRATGT